MGFQTVHTSVKSVRSHRAGCTIDLVSVQALGVIKSLASLSQFESDPPDLQMCAFVCIHSTLCASPGSYLNTRVIV